MSVPALSRPNPNITITRKIEESKEVPNKCKEHGKALEFYCKNSKCLLKEHRTHDVEDLQEVKEESCKLLRTNIESLEIMLQQREKQFETCKKEMNEALEDSIRKVETKKNEIIQTYDKLIKEINDHKTNLNKKIVDELSNFQGIITLISGMLEVTNKQNTTYEEILNTLEILKTIDSEDQKHFEEVRNFSYPVYRENKMCAEKYFGNLAKEEICIDTVETKSTPVIAVDLKPPISSKEKENNIKCEGKDLSAS